MSNPFTAIVTLIRRLLNNPTRLLEALSHDGVSTLLQFHTWSPSYALPRGTYLKMDLVKSHPEYKAALFAIGSHWLSPAQQSLVEAHLRPSTWRSYRSAIKAYLTWSWRTYSTSTILPATSLVVQEFLACNPIHSRYIPALRKLHELLSLPVLFDDPLTKIMRSGCRKLSSSSRRDRSFISLSALRSLVRQAA